MKKLTLISLASLCILPAVSVAQALDPASLLKPLGNSGPSYSGDYSGKRHSSLYDPANGKILWHTHLGQISNAPETHMLDGGQDILIAVGDSLYSIGLY
jgi:hypothetical protein